MNQSQALRNSILLAIPIEGHLHIIARRCANVPPAPNLKKKRKWRNRPVS